MSVEKALKQRVILLCGEEEIMRRRALEEILKTLGMPHDDFDVEYFEGGNGSPDSWISSCGTVPFLAERRVAIVRRLLKANTEYFNTKLLTTLPPTALIVLVADDEVSSSESGTKKFRDNAKFWEKAVKDSKGAVLEFKRDAKLATETIKQEVEKQGLKIGHQALGLLTEMTAGSVSRAMSELEKLIVAAGPKGTVTEADIRRLVVPARDWNVFAITDAIASANPVVALRQLRILIGSSAKPDEAAYASILPMIGRHLRLVWQARVCLDARCSPSNPTAAIAKTFPAKPNLSQISGFQQDKIIASARKLDLDILTKCFQILSDADASLKGALTSYTPIDTLERMILEMCDVSRPKVRIQTY